MNLEVKHSDLLKWFQTNYPDIVENMNDCSHHFDMENLNPYHLEGDIWTHTLLVYKNSEIFSPENHYIKWSGLLHDIGKPAASEIVEQRKRKRFIGHEGVSAWLSIDILNNTDLSRKDKIHIFELIAYHGSLFHHIKSDGTVKSDTKNVFKGKKRLLEDLVLQVRNDSFGRWTDTPDYDPLFTQMLPEVFEPTVNDVSDEVYSGEKPHQLTILVGPPGSGKSTWVKDNVSDDTVVASRDKLVEEVGRKYGQDNYSKAFKFLFENKEISRKEVDEVLDKTVIEARRNKRDVLIDMTNMSKKSRRKWINSFQKDYKVNCVLFCTGYETLKSRCKTRAKDTGKHIPENVLLNMTKRFSLPMYSEGFDSIEYVWDES